METDRKIIAVLTFLFLILLISQGVTLAMVTDDLENNELSKEDRYREILLSFYTQELVAHGAMLFASSTASFMFFTRFIKRVNRRFWSLFVFVLFSGVLLGFSIYVGFRLLFYGALTNGVAHFSTTECDSFGKFVNEVTDYTVETEKIPLFFKTIRRGFLDPNPYNIMLVSLYMGFFFAYLIYYAFARHSLDQTRLRAGLMFVFFIVPPILGLWGAFSNKVCPEWTLIIPVIWYCLTIVTLYYFSRNRYYWFNI